MNNKYNLTEEHESILDVSKRTAKKIASRFGLSCAICNWNYASCDIHHIVEKCKGGTDKMDNLTSLCPNCHRSVHEHGEKFIEFEKLKDLSLDKLFPNWKDYYNPKRSKTHSYKNVNKECSNKNCTNKIPYYMKFCCYECSHKDKEVANWDYDNLINLLEKHKGIMTHVARELNVSDNAVRKKCNKLGIDFKKYRV